MKNSMAFTIVNLRNNFIDYCNSELKKIGLSQGLLFYIIYIGKNRGCSPKELTEALNMDAGHTTRTISKLLDMGFITKERNEKDKRAHILKLTEKGEEAFKMSYSLFEKWDEKIKEKTGEGKYREILEELKNAIDSDDYSCYKKY